MFQEIGVGCAVLPVAPDWRSDSPLRGRDDDAFTQEGVSAPTPVLFTRTSCAEARATRPGDISSELGLNPQGFLSVTPTEEGRAFLSVSLDFAAEGSPDVQQVRIRDLFLTFAEGVHEQCVY